MDRNSNRIRMAVAVGAAAICLGGSGAAVPAHAKTDSSGGGSSAAGTGDIDRSVAERKAQMVHDYFAHALDRPAYRPTDRPPTCR